LGKVLAWVARVVQVGLAVRFAWLKMKELGF